MREGAVKHLNFEIEVGHSEISPFCFSVFHGPLVVVVVGRSTSKPRHVHRYLARPARLLRGSDQHAHLAGG